jgi:hypothetical protein
LPLDRLADQQGEVQVGRDKEMSAEDLTLGSVRRVLPGQLSILDALDSHGSDRPASSSESPSTYPRSMGLAEPGPQAASSETGELTQERRPAVPERAPAWLRASVSLHMPTAPGLTYHPAALTYALRDVLAGRSPMAMTQDDEPGKVTFFFSIDADKPSTAERTVREVATRLTEELGALSWEPGTPSFYTLDAQPDSESSTPSPGLRIVR